jgi:hypothetical protein
VLGVVQLASENGKSLVLNFWPEKLGGYIGMMPVLAEDSTGVYRDLVVGEPVEVVKATRPSAARS